MSSTSYDSRPVMFATFTCKNGDDAHPKLSVLSATLETRPINPDAGDDREWMEMQQRGRDYKEALIPSISSVTVRAVNI